MDDYLNGICRKHENTVAAKELDRIHHVDAISAQTGPIFLSYHADNRINALVNAEKEKKAPVYDFISEDGIGHRVWIIADNDVVAELCRLFSEIKCTYIADCHHRAASAVKVALKRREETSAKGGYDASAEYNDSVIVHYPKLAVMEKH